MSRHYRPLTYLESHFAELCRTYAYHHLPSTSKWSLLEHTRYSFDNAQGKPDHYLQLMFVLVEKYHLLVKRAQREEEEEEAEEPSQEGLERAPAPGTMPVLTLPGPQSHGDPSFFGNSPPPLTCVGIHRRPTSTAVANQYEDTLRAWKRNLDTIEQLHPNHPKTYQFFAAFTSDWYHGASDGHWSGSDVLEEIKNVDVCCINRPLGFLMNTLSWIKVVKTMKKNARIYFKYDDGFLLQTTRDEFLQALRHKEDLSYSLNPPLRVLVSDFISAEVLWEEILLDSSPFRRRGRDGDLSQQTLDALKASVKCLDTKISVRRLGLRVRDGRRNQRLVSQWPEEERRRL